MFKLLCDYCPQILEELYLNRDYSDNIVTSFDLSEGVNVQVSKKIKNQSVQVNLDIGLSKHVIVGINELKLEHTEEDEDADEETKTVIIAVPSGADNFMFMFVKKYTKGASEQYNLVEFSPKTKKITVIGDGLGIELPSYSTDISTDEFLLEILTQSKTLNCNIPSYMLKEAYEDMQLIQTVINNLKVK